LRSFGMTADGTDRTAVARLFTQSDPISLVLLIARGAFHPSGKSVSRIVATRSFLGIVARMTIISMGSFALCASTSKAHSDAVAPQ